MAQPGGAGDTWVMLKKRDEKFSVLGQSLGLKEASLRSSVMVFLLLSRGPKKLSDSQVSPNSNHQVERKEAYSACMHLFL